MGAKWLIGGVARIFQPGCKVDTCLILEGEQGLLKSTALRTLAGDAFFTDDIADLGSKDSVMQTRGVLIIELAELDSMSREVSRVKAFMSRQVDRIRPPYGRRVIEVPRECIFAGTTNKDTYLKDETGGRRFWPVKVGAVSVSGRCGSGGGSMIGRPRQVVRYGIRLGVPGRWAAVRRTQRHDRR